MEEKVKNIAKEIKELLVGKLPDVQVHILKFPLDEITVCVFWNLSAGVYWNDSETFKFNINKYHDVLKKDIKPYFENI